MDDARSTAMTELVNGTDNGSDVPGKSLEESSDAIRHYLYSADLVISRGQGNYETLSDTE